MSGHRAPIGKVVKINRAAAAQAEEAARAAGGGRGGGNGGDGKKDAAKGAAKGTKLNVSALLKRQGEAKEAKRLAQAQKALDQRDMYKRPGMQGSSSSGALAQGTGGRGPLPGGGGGGSLGLRKSPAGKARGRAKGPHAVRLRRRRALYLSFSRGPRLGRQGGARGGQAAAAALPPFRACSKVSTVALFLLVFYGCLSCCHSCCTCVCSSYASRGCVQVLAERFLALIDDLMKRPHSYLFHRPVPKDMPRYYELIASPIDLGTIRDRFKHNQSTAIALEAQQTHSKRTSYA